MQQSGVRRKSRSGALLFHDLEIGARMKHEVDSNKSQSPAGRAPTGANKNCRSPPSGRNYHAQRAMSQVGEKYQNILDEFEARFAAKREDDPNTESIARIYAWIGNNDKAFEWLDEMVAIEGPRMLANVDTDLYEKIKSDPRWRALRDKPVEAIKFNYALPPGMSID